MTGGSIAFVSHFRLRPGAGDRLREMWQVVAERLRAEKPGTQVFLGYLDPATERVSIVHVFTDAAAMTAHVEGAEARSAAAAEVMTPLGWAIYGPAPAPAVQMLREAAVAAGVPLELAAEPLGGFTRFADG